MLQVAFLKDLAFFFLYLTLYLVTFLHQLFILIELLENRGWKDLDKVIGSILFLLLIEDTKYAGLNLKLMSERL